MKIEVNAKAAQITERETLTVGSKGIMIAVSFSQEWDELNKTALFWDGTESKPIPVLMFSDFILLPPEMTATKALKPLVTFVGKDTEGAVVFPAVECPLGSVWYGIRGGDYPTEPPSTDWVQQIENGVFAANQTANKALQTVVDNAPLTERAEAAATNAEKFATEAQQSAEAAERAEQQAGAHVTEASNEADRAKQEADQALSNKLNGIDQHNQDPASHPHLLAEVARVESIAKGRNFGVVFDTKSDMEAWLLDPENVKTLEVGTNLYIRDMNTPDYWWDGAKAQELEVEHPDLTQYVTKAQLSMELPAVVTQEEYDRLQAAGQLVPGRIYYIDLAQGGV